MQLIQITFRIDTEGRAHLAVWDEDESYPSSLYARETIISTIVSLPGNNWES